MAGNSKRIWIGVAVAAGLVIILLVVLAGRGDVPQVRIASAAREDLTASITSNGKVEPISPAVARAEFPTFVERLIAAEGQAVHRGQVVLTLGAADVRSELAQARANLLTAQSNLRNARAGGPPADVAQLNGDLQKAQTQVANLERTHAALEQLVAKQAATQDELAQNEAALAQARTNLNTLQQKKDYMAQQAGVDVEGSELRVKQLQDQVQSLDEKSRSATVTAPSDGILYSLPVRQGDYVQVGQTLAEMADLRQVRVRAFVDEPDLGWLEINQVVHVNWDAKPASNWSGKVEQVPKQVVARGTRSVGEVLCSVDNSKLELLPNVNVEVRILVRERPKALVVPRAAVRYDNGKHYVFVYAGDKIHRRDVTVGIASATKYEVVAGLAEGDRIALPEDQELRDGMEIRPTEAK
jgi:HlyD family secretion protein